MNGEQNENWISDLYHDQSREEPDKAVDQRILQQAREHSLSDNLLNHTGHQVSWFRQWYRSLSVVASVAIVAVVFVVNQPLFVPQSIEEQAADSSLENNLIAMQVPSGPEMSRPQAMQSPARKMEQSEVSAELAVTALTEAEDMQAISEQGQRERIIIDGQINQEYFDSLLVRYLAITEKEIRNEELKRVRTMSSTELQQQIFDGLRLYKAAYPSQVIPKRYMDVLSEAQKQQLQVTGTP